MKHLGIGTTLCVKHVMSSGFLWRFVAFVASGFCLCLGTMHKTHAKWMRKARSSSVSFAANRFAAALATRPSPLRPQGLKSGELAKQGCLPRYEITMHSPWETEPWHQSCKQRNVTGKNDRTWPKSKFDVLSWSFTLFDLTEKRCWPTRYSPGKCPIWAHTRCRFHYLKSGRRMRKGCRKMRILPAMIR